MRKKLGLILLIVLLVAGGAYLGGKWFIRDIARQVAELTILPIQLANVGDGTYLGSYKLFPVEVEVKVTVKDKKITGIELIKHDNGQGQPAEALLSKVIETQSLELDVISGATQSSKVILKAVENALSSGKK